MVDHGLRNTYFFQALRLGLRQQGCASRVFFPGIPLGGAALPPVSLHAGLQAIAPPALEFLCEPQSTERF